MRQNKLYVGNIASSLNQDALQEAFSTYGENEVFFATDNITGNPRGFAFITFTLQKNAEAALEMNGKELGGRKLVVNMAKEKSKRGRQGRREYR